MTRDVSVPSSLCHAGRGRTACGQRGTPLWTPQRPEEQRPETQRSKSWAPHYYHAKPNDVVEAARDEPETIGAARVPTIVEERAAPQHAGNIIRRSQVFP